MAVTKVVGDQEQLFRGSPKLGGDLSHGDGSHCVVARDELAVCVCAWCVRARVMDQLEELRTMKSKEEKSTPRRDSVFSRISSYRQKLVRTSPQRSTAAINSTDVMRVGLLIIGQ